ncbi:type I-E CRISPR-associated endoribonuclease Cas2e [Isoptericola sp. NPDC019693]|uniref:type I-E CRISPR-associated endoribonuclease Cas2e n=1 Tax=Isoptericola sp. NPDC019693 TaxID=3364009 RepID=UPI0037989C87
MGRRRQLVGRPLRVGRRRCRVRRPGGAVLMVVVVLSVTPERLRGVLTRWLLEVSVGVYVGHLPARVREYLWLRIVEDVGRGRALMVWARQGEQRLDFRSHNHAWETVEVEGITLIRRQTAESREIRRAKETARARRLEAGAESSPVSPGSGLEDEGLETNSRGSGGSRRRNWSHAARRRRFQNAVEKRHGQQGPEEGV